MDWYIALATAPGLTTGEKDMIQEDKGPGGAL
jgi:hypothetical protein